MINARNDKLFDFWQENSDAPEYFKFLEKYIDSLCSKNPNTNLKELLKNYPKLEFSIKIQGENWNDDYVDITIAKYVLAMQESLNDILEDYDIEPNTILVKVKVENGCKKIIADLNELIKPIINFASNMNGTQKLLFSLIALAGFSVWEGVPAFKDYMINKEETKRIDLIRESQTEITKQAIETINKTVLALKEVVENKSVYEKPYRIIERELEESDRVAINNDSNFISKKVFSENLKAKRNPRREFENKYLDGSFHIADISVDKQIITIDIDGKKIPVNFSELSKNDKEKLLRNISNGGNLTENSVELQLNINCNEYRIKEAKLHGFGAPRSDTVKPSDIPLEP